MDSNQSWLLVRVSSRIGYASVGSLAGWVVGHYTSFPVTLAVVGCAAALIIQSTVDTWRGQLLLEWLRAPDMTPPSISSIWGEIAYRVQRLLQLREHAVELERARLADFLSAIEVSPNGVMLLDAADHISWVSASAANHFGLDPQRDLQQRVTNLIRQPAFVQYLSAGDFRDGVKCPMTTGAQSWLQIHIKRYGDGLKLVLSQDITERERADHMRRDFVANVSHEIRTPLTVLSGFIETMGSLPLTEIERQRVIGLMSQQAERMQTLVADLLTLAQIEGSPSPAPDRWLRVDELMQRIDNDLRGLSRGRHPVTVTIDSQDKCCEIAVVESEWLSAMGNLVSNAVRYTPDGQPIDVRWQMLRDGRAEFSVKDGGVGIASEHIPRLTERFYRADSSRSRNTGGTGLGLSIVKHVVQRHGGDFKVSSELGRGSTFSLTLPAVRVRLV
ncbi:MAG: phosphate regulon sensor histidine kinase PhoR [Burkholderiales bacterium RIFCSPLOWO2_12_FULL_64_99]|uniref:phosphate regulon sensor histidine kinase PhoR n=1 Tax=Aquabacterium sp. TaxID=1872578 RepID=UPI0008BB4D05|nr:phosphate regulon sensor histidine kinase PhoR [Aquabacterium sp.]OGB02409.1 MAG: phosphate regulon sensor histidine kinase PhoR [Burkholderiales bacterium RIFCSPHIGHO2_12_FULL_63_20]OGB67937.1 MAG: phosphate regulon sensor histidine kinase PhoR [Burkholderiales bacterium RIFCSPLOWO2_12_FULL_64_99]